MEYKLVRSDLKDLESKLNLEAFEGWRVAQFSMGGTPMWEAFVILQREKKK